MRSRTRGLRAQVDTEGWPLPDPDSSQTPNMNHPCSPPALFPWASLLHGILPSSYSRGERATSRPGSSCCSAQADPRSGHPAEGPAGPSLSFKGCAPSAGFTTAGLTLLCRDGPCLEEGRQEICSLSCLCARSYHRGRPKGESCMAKARNSWEWY